ncbi:hypothetical protein KM043_011142 [Ampulex compressa]|nr:hypothetical protein KM043_011142 [Ampulex compressa]
MSLPSSSSSSSSSSSLLPPPEEQQAEWPLFGWDDGKITPTADLPARSSINLGLLGMGEGENFKSQPSVFEDSNDEEVKRKRRVSGRPDYRYAKSPKFPRNEAAEHACTHATWASSGIAAVRQEVIQAGSFPGWPIGFQERRGSSEFPVSHKHFKQYPTPSFIETLMAVHGRQDLLFLFLKESSLAQYHIYPMAVDRSTTDLRISAIRPIKRPGRNAQRCITVLIDSRTGPAISEGAVEKVGASKVGGVRRSQFEGERRSLEWEPVGSSFGLEPPWIGAYL